MIRRNNEKRGVVSRETMSDRMEIATRLAGMEQQVVMLKPILTRLFSPSPLKKSLMQFLRAARFRNGSDCVDRLALRHLDVLIGEFIKWCPNQCAQLIGGHLCLEQQDDHVPDTEDKPEPILEPAPYDEFFVIGGETEEREWAFGENEWTI
jgi:hypothetical protein